MEQTQTPNTEPIPTLGVSMKPPKHPVSPMLHKLRHYFVYVIVGGLVISAVIAIIAVLIGNMSGLVGKSISTLAIIVFHSLVALAFISTTSTKQPNKGSTLVINTLFAITVLSLITALLSTWEVITDGNFITRQYLVFFAAFVTSLVLYGLFQSTENDKSTIMSRNTAIGSSLAVFILLLPILYNIGTLPEFYYRILTAVNIVAGVSVVITVIFHWYFISKHPELKHDSKPLSIGGVIGRSLLVLFLIWILVAVLSTMLRTLSQTNSQLYQSSPSRYY